MSKNTLEDFDRCYFISEKRLDEFEWFLLEKMIVCCYIGGKKTKLKNIRRGIPKHDVGFIKTAYNSLKKKGFFLSEIRNREPYFSINPKTLQNAHDLIRFNRCPLCNCYLEDLNYCRECKKYLAKIREIAKD